MLLRTWLCLLLMSCLGADAGKRKEKNKNLAPYTQRPYLIDNLPREDDEDDDAKNATSISDFFPYIMGRKTKLLRLQPLATMYYKPGYATFYRKFYADFAILVHPPMDCLAVYICFMHQTNDTKSGLARIDIESSCADSIRILTMEQILYHVKAGKAKPYVNLKAELDFRRKKGDPDVYQFQVWSDFDHEDVNDAKQVTVEISAKNRDILLLTSSPYCHAILFNDDGAVPGSIMQIESNTDASQFYRIMERTQYFPHILSRTAEDSRYKTLKSEIVININKADTSESDCCPKLNEFTGSLNDDECNFVFEFSTVDSMDVASKAFRPACESAKKLLFHSAQEISVKPIANQYKLAKIFENELGLNGDVLRVKKCELLACAVEELRKELARFAWKTHMRPACVPGNFSKTRTAHDINGKTLKKHRQAHYQVHHKLCFRAKYDDFSPLQAIFIEVYEECEWMKICFDKSKKWCESEGSALSLYFVHDVFIPTDSDEAVMFALPMERLSIMRINFMMNEPAIEFSYGLANNFYEATHVMHMQAYADVKFDPSKFNLHVIKAKGCQARLYNANFGEALYRPKVPNCLKVDYCQCFSYTADRTT